MHHKELGASPSVFFQANGWRPYLVYAQQTRVLHLWRRPVLCAFFSQGNKRLGDLVVGSLVVRETSLAELKPIWQTAPNTESRLPVGAGPLGAINLSPQDVALIESYLSRRSTLDYHLRSKVAYEVFKKIKDKVSIPEGTPLSPESLLEAISLERRNTAQYS